MGRRDKEKRRRNDEDEEGDDYEDEQHMEKYRRVSKFLDIDAQEADSDEDEDDFDPNEDGFFVDGPEDEIPADYEDGEIGRRLPLTLPRRQVDDNEDDIEAIEKMVNERYGSSRATEDYDDYYNEETSLLDQQSLLPSVQDPKLWLVKCLPGHEKEVAGSLMRKSLDKSSELRILSAIALDHLKGYIYVEAYQQSFVREACKGIRKIFANNGITMVPVKEMSSVLTVESKRVIDVSKGDWVRMKRSTYKGSIAKVVKVHDIGRRVTVKIIPKLSSLSLSDRQDGINYFIKTVALSSVETGGIKPTIDEVEHIEAIGNGKVDRTTLFKGKDEGCWIKGDVVTVVKGELKNLTGVVEFVDGDLVHLRPKEMENIPLETVTVQKSDLAKYFEPGCHVKVVHGVRKDVTGMVIKVDGNKLVILSDASKSDITVLSSQVIKHDGISESSSALSVACSNRERSHNTFAPRSVPHPSAANRSHPGHRVPSTGRGQLQFAKRNDSMIGKNVKIIQGPYRGYRGCVKGVNGHSIRVELEAQMKIVTVNRSQISDKLAAPSSTSWNITKHDGSGSVTPSYPRTPMHSMGGETPWRTPLRTPSRPSTPVHHGSSAAPSLEHWNPFSFSSPTRLVPPP